MSTRAPSGPPRVEVSRLAGVGQDEDWLEALHLPGWLKTEGAGEGTVGGGEGA